MKKILFALLFIAMAFSQFDNSIAGWYKGAFYVPDGTVYSEGVIVVDEGTLAGETLDEVDFATSVTWSGTNDFTYAAGVNFEFVWTAWQTSDLEQLDADFILAAVADVYYSFTYTIAVTTAFDGDGAATITTAFALTAVELDLTTGTHTVYFKSAAVPSDLIIRVVSGSDTEGTFTIDDVTLKEIQGGDLDISGTLLIRGVNIGTAVTGKLSNVVEDLSPQLGANLDIQAFDLTGTGLWQAGTVAFGKGGTGLSAWTQYLIPYAATTGSIGQIAIGAAGEVLTSAGAGVAPSFQAAAGGGDFSDGGEVGGAARTLGNTDAFAMGFETNNVERAQFTAAGHFVPIGTHAYDLGSAGADWNNAYLAIGYIGTLYADGGIWHTGDADTKITFSTDKVEHYAGNVKFMEFIEDAVDYISIAEAVDVDWYTAWMTYNYGNNLLTFKAKKTVFAPQLTSAAGTSVADDAAITVTAYIMRMVGADVDALLDTDPAINDGSADGQIVIIQGVADGNTVTIVDNVNTQLNEAASCTLGDGDVIALMWDSHYSMWIELYRSNN